MPPKKSNIVWNKLFGWQVGDEASFVDPYTGDYLTGILVEKQKGIGLGNTVWILRTNNNLRTRFGYFEIPEDHLNIVDDKNGKK